MRVLVWEALCGGLLANAGASQSLVREGRAMLEALVDDFQRLDGCEVSTAWDESLGPHRFHEIDVLPVTHGDHQTALHSALAATDAALIVAPESDGLLERYTRMAEQAGVRCLGSPSSAASFCADKLAVADALAAAGVPTIETRPCETGAGAAPLDFPFVVKPRFGAGCVDTWLVDSAATWDRLCTLLDDRLMARAVVQPFVPGRALSVALVFDRAGNELVLPVATQRIGHARCLDYRGGRISTSIAADVAAKVQDAARAACRVCPELRGYVGIDLIQPPHGEPVVVEINPRTTTSYIGYRAGLNENLAAALLDEQPPGVKRMSALRSVSYHSDGTVDGETHQPGYAGAPTRDARRRAGLLKTMQ